MSVKTKIGGSTTIRLSHGAIFQIVCTRVGAVEAFRMLVFIGSPRSVTGQL
jgi:hypothetical protein